MNNLKIYFVSDFHLGIPDHDNSLVREKLFVQWLDIIKNDASELYLMGDIFDFWFEYSKVVPKGFIRFFGKLSELVDKGIKIHLFKGNHDLWAFDYLSQEIGIEIHRKPTIIERNNKKLFLSHGDGLGKGDYGYKFLKKILENKILQFLFKWLHPDFGIWIALKCSKLSRTVYLKREKNNKQGEQIKLKNDRLLNYAKKYISENQYIDYFVFGHKHQPVKVNICKGSYYINLGDWITNFTFACLNKSDLQLFTFKDGKITEFIQE